MQGSADRFEGSSAAKLQRKERTATSTGISCNGIASIESIGVKDRLYGAS